MRCRNELSRMRLRAALVASCRIAVLLACGVAAAQETSDDGPRVVEVIDIHFPEGASRLLEKRGSWLPVYVELKSLTSRTETVIVEGSVSANKKLAFSTRERIEVSPGAPTR